MQRLTAADLAAIGVEAGFVAEVRRRFSPGSAALVAEIEESWVLPVDIRMEQLGGNVMRQSRAPLADALHYLQLAVREEDAADLEAECATRTAAVAPACRSHWPTRRCGLQAARSMAQCGIDTRRHEAEAKVRLLRQQAAKAAADRRVTIERQIGAIRAEYVHWAAKLRAVWQSTPRRWRSDRHPTCAQGLCVLDEGEVRGYRCSGRPPCLPYPWADAEVCHYRKTENA